LTDAAAKPVATAVPGPPTRSMGAWALDVLIWGGVAALLIYSFAPLELVRVSNLFSNNEHTQNFARELLRPDFADWKLFVGKMWETVQIALWGTFIAIFAAVPMGLAAARNIAPFWVVTPVRWLMNMLRSIPDLVIGLLFVVAVGLGSPAGVLAIALNTAGVLAKLFSEAVESIDKGPVEGVRATGATKLHEIVWGVIPQVAPLWTSVALYRFESNSRSATVLGLIGAGGIGQVLFDNMNAFNFRAVSAIVIIVVIAVTLIDMLSQAMRKRLM
jgi:phosphonate transport system permease protein